MGEGFQPLLVTVRCTIVQSAVLRLHVVCRQNCKSSKLTVRTLSPTPSLLVAQRPSTYSQGNMGKFGQGLEVKWVKVACWSTKAAISLIRVNIMRKSYYTEGLQELTNALLNGTIPDPLGSGVRNSKPTTEIAIISGTSNLVRTFTGSIHPNKSPLRILRKT